MRGPMKNVIVSVFIGLTLILSACGGGPPLIATPPHLQAGTDQIIKGTAAYKKGCYKKAFELFFRAHELYAASDQMDGVAMSFNNIGTVYRATGDLESALAFFDKAGDIYRDLGNSSGEVQSLSNKAAVLIDLGRFDQAEAILDEASKKPAGGSFAPLLNNRGVLLTKKKDYPEAEKVLREALSAAGSDLSLRATVNSAMGNLMLETKRYKEAVDFYMAALSADRTDGFYRGIADDLKGIGRAYLEMGDRAGAVRYWEQSVKIYALIGSSAEVKKIMADIKTAAEGTGVDIRVTELFVNRWLEGKLYENPCED
jgi:tetratricopeptide (TPR) repeat protein